MKKIILTILCVLSLLSTFASTTAHAQNSRGCAAGIAPETCRSAPTPHGCPTGKHWSNAGTDVNGKGLAHCVAVDPICGAGTELVHDPLDNPSCRPLPTCANGAANYPVCTPPVCGNGATNYPACTAFPTCANGASNYPVCTVASGGPNLSSLPNLFHEAGIGATIALAFRSDGAWTASRLNCGNESIPGWTVQSSWEYCKETSQSGSLLLPGSNPADFEISVTDQVIQTGVSHAAVNQPVCATWQNLNAMNQYCSTMLARSQITNDPRDSSDYSWPADQSVQFSLNLRRKSNPGEVWTRRIILGASISSGTQCPYRGFCYG